MDVVSDAVAAMRTGRPHSSRVEKRAPWGVRFQPFAGAGFHVVLQGTCWLVPHDASPIPLGAGDVVFLPRGSEHVLADSPSTPPVDATAASLVELRSDSELDGASPVEPAGLPHTGSATVLLCGGYLLDQGRLHPLLGHLPDVLHLPAHLGRHGPLRTAVDLLCGELGDRRPGADGVVPALLDVLLLYILRVWFQEQSRHTANGWAAALNEPTITAALRSIHSDPARQWTVEELGAQGGLSRAAFARRFTSLVGRPPLAYLTWWRMTIAARLLRDSDAPLRVVAERTGYTSEYAFARAFRREFGIAPGRFRRR